MPQMPTAYSEGYSKAIVNAADRRATDNYIQHTTIGDPELDPVMEELSSMPPGGPPPVHRGRYRTARRGSAKRAAGFARFLQDSRRKSSVA